MKLTRLIIMGLAFLVPATATIARAEEKPAAEGEKKDEGKKKGKKGKKAEGEGEKKEDKK